MSAAGKQAHDLIAPICSIAPLLIDGFGNVVCSCCSLFVIVCWFAGMYVCLLEWLFDWLFDWLNILWFVGLFEWLVRWWVFMLMGMVGVLNFFDTIPGIERYHELNLYNFTMSCEVL